MDYAFYKLRFLSAVHFGGGRLTDGEVSVSADTVFSALCHEALKIGGPESVEALARDAREGRFALSDALPFFENDFFVPKPVTRAAAQKARAARDEYGDKKAFKKLKYVPVSLLGDFLSGNFDPAGEAAIQKNIGVRDVRARVAAPRSDEPRPYHVGSFTFAPKAGLYLAVGHDGDLSLFDDLLKSLSFGGVGGKRSSGFGRFEAEPAKCPELARRLASGGGPWMSLSVSMAAPDELDSALDGAEYVLKKRSGFVLSPDYAEAQLKKRDFYSFVAGSCFRAKFVGGVFDVSREGRHPVYRYAKPMFAEVSA
jgi:CRISPR-associated protein Csm4